MPLWTIHSCWSNRSWSSGMQSGDTNSFSLGFAMAFMKPLLPFLLLFLTSLLSPISCNKVSLGLYYESLCPYSASFIVDSLDMIFSDGLIDIVDLKLVPWGNSKLYGPQTFICQHGPTECLLNTVESCAIDAWPDVNVHFPFIYCVESLVYHDNYTYWESCFEKLGLDATPVTDCLNSDRGTELELRYAAETNALEPPHTYVPWVVVDGQPLYDDYREFASYICKAYKGSAIPTACSESSYSFKSLFGGASSTKSKLPRKVKTILSWLHQPHKIIASF